MQPYETPHPTVPGATSATPATSAPFVAGSEGYGSFRVPACVRVPDGTLLAYAEEQRIRRGEIPAADGRRVWLRESADSGLNWSVPREITEAVKRPEWRCCRRTPRRPPVLQHPYGLRRPVPARGRALRGRRREPDPGSWRPAHTVDDRPAAYSDLVRVDRGTVGLLYETGETGRTTGSPSAGFPWGS